MYIHTCEQRNKLYISVLMVLIFFSLVTPSVFSVDGKVKFQIDSQSGVLQSGSFGFDYEDNMDRLYTVIMLAKDKGTDPMQQTVSIIIVHMLMN